MSGDAWIERRVLVTVGTGGVGKTTIAAALGLAAARRGRRVLVLTIDPARRLADALGVPELGHEPRAIAREHLEGAGLDCPGELFAMMLDTKRTFDELVGRFAPDDDARARILANPIYANLTDALAGSREYSAIEKLHQLYDSGEYDLIVLDTPPSSHALEFLDAPRRLTGFLGSSALRLLLHPAAAVGRTGFRLFRSGSELVLRGVERVTGLAFLTAISEFLLAFEAMLGGFRERAREVEVLLRDPACGFLLVAGPEADQARAARAFWERLREERVHLLGLVQNRVRSWPRDHEIPECDAAAQKLAVEWLGKALAKQGPPFEPRAAAEVLVSVAERQAALARRDAGVSASLIEALSLSPEQVRTIPLFDEDVHALGALERMGALLLGGELG